jgi:DNA-binding NarL/FixJ family response regulator
MARKKKNKSDSYQHKIVEIAVDPYILNDFSLSEGLGSQLNLAKYSEAFYELRQQLMREVLRIINSDLTKRQCEVMLLRLEGLTQTQIANNQVI